MHLSLRRFPIRQLPVGLLFTLLGVAMVAAATANAATLTVTSTNDSGPGSLRQALADSNNGDNTLTSLPFRDSSSYSQPGSPMLGSISSIP